MKTLEDLLTLERLLAEFEFPVSPILQYAIQEKKEELTAKEEEPEIIQATELALNEVFMPEEDEVRSMSIRKKATCLRVYRADGTYIQEKKAAITFAQAIKEVGVLRVKGLDIYMDSMNIITDGGNPQYPSAQYQISDNWYVNTHSNTATKKRQLETIFHSFNLNWRAEIVES